MRERMMSGNKVVLALDFGASSGRAFLGCFDGSRITMQESHRFSNDPVMLNGVLYWDFYRLFFEITHGILKAQQDAPVSSIGIDTWGVDFGLLRKDGSLIEAPVHYRDGRTETSFPHALQKINAERFYRITGVQLMPLNTVFQLYAVKEQRSYLLDGAETMLCMPDLFNYFLTGEKRTERSIASTTQMLDADSQTWSEEIIAALGLPTHILTSIIPSGTEIGLLKPSVCEGFGKTAVKVTAVCGHDTQSAVAAVPADCDDFIFVSCGTWSLFGTELDAPLISDDSARFNITNEIGFGGKTNFLKNCTGLWLIQESKRQWQREGKNYSFAELEAEARKAKPFVSFIDPDAPELGVPGDIPGRIRAYCKNTGQPVPETVGSIMQCIYQSLAFLYRKTLEEIELCTGKRYPVIHIVGGGIKDTHLCRLAANACGRPVKAGPTEASALGNIVVQLIASGDVRNIKEARKVIAASYPVAEYEPEDIDLWDEHYGAFRTVCR